MRGQMVYAGDKVTLTVSRESYVKWLPSIYQRADLNGRNFCRDFLWIIQHLFGSIEEQPRRHPPVFDPYEAPEHFLPWLGSWSAMVLEEDWPIEKKRLLIRKAIELYRIRGTVKGLKLFISLFTGHEPDIKENQWPFRGWRVGATSEIGVDSVVLPPVNLAHTFIVEMPVSYKDVSPEAVIRIHEIIQMEKPANTQYYLRFATEGGGNDLSEFMAIGGGVIGGIGLGAGEAEAITSEAELKRAEEQVDGGQPTADSRKTQMLEIDAAFAPATRTRPPLPKAPRADTAPVEGKEGPRSSKAGGFEGAAREMAPVTPHPSDGSAEDRGDEAGRDPDQGAKARRRGAEARQEDQAGHAASEKKDEVEEGSAAEKRSGEKVNGDRTRREGARVQAHQLLQGVSHHREGLERRRALPHRQAPPAQPDDALAGHRPRLLRATCSVHRARARRPLGRGPAGLRDRRHGQRPRDLRRDDPQHHRSRSSSCRRRSTSCCATTRSSPTSSRTRRTSSTRATAACSSRCKVELSQTEPDIKREVELARILPREGRDAHPRRARSARPAARTRSTCATCRAAASPARCSPGTMRAAPRAPALQVAARRARVHAARRECAAHDALQALQHGADAAHANLLDLRNVFDIFKLIIEMRGRARARRRRPPPDDRAEEGVLRVPPPGRDPARPARREQEQHRSVAEPPRVSGEVRPRSRRRAVAGEKPVHSTARRGEEGSRRSRDIKDWEGVKVHASSPSRRWTLEGIDLGARRRDRDPQQGVRGQAHRSRSTRPRTPTARARSSSTPTARPSRTPAARTSTATASSSCSNITPGRPLVVLRRMDYVYGDYELELFVNGKKAGVVLVRRHRPRPSLAQLAVVIAAELVTEDTVTREAAAVTAGRDINMFHIGSTSRNDRIRLTQCSSTR